MEESAAEVADWLGPSRVTVWIIGDIVADGGEAPGSSETRLGASDEDDSNIAADKYDDDELEVSLGSKTCGDAPDDLELNVADVYNVGKSDCSIADPINPSAVDFDDEETDEDLELSLGSKTGREAPDDLDLNDSKDNNSGWPGCSIADSVTPSEVNLKKSLTEKKKENQQKTVQNCGPPS